MLAPEFFTPDFCWHGGSVGTIAGIGAYAETMRQFFAGLPGAVAIEKDAAPDGDTVAMRFIFVSVLTAGDRYGRGKVSRGPQRPTSELSPQLVGPRLPGQPVADDPRHSGLLVPSCLPGGRRRVIGWQRVADHQIERLCQKG